MSTSPNLYSRHQKLPTSRTQIVDYTRKTVVKIGIRNPWLFGLLTIRLAPTSLFLFLMPFSAVYLLTYSHGMEGKSSSQNVSLPKLRLTQTSDYQTISV